ncbi:hypothetical protein PTSG_12802 [Salpingoeca rosetta]|uniref:Uncharacterized protein n=1 Tax=Salpingoeca rosetta (strain ATCC 50818 / BSB-021) TaxID=946362 RepID=F2UKU6_SALR5|nr:uncharacterized protein PTSG_12802 [Salpingoeca rosetta]EGD77745.1 hypothetical protein PTSG_12802 [Salpingoeca rosetta]|eukprot:XP_004990221.1 hypothetical protein PTSG_12802 [Salpingoeca rosetta]
MVGQCIQGGIVSDSNLDDDDDDDDDGDDRAAYELAYVHGGDEGEYGAAAADHGSGGGDDAAGLAWRRRRLGGGVEVELGRAALLARALLSSTSQSRSSSVSSSAPVTTTATDTREQSTAEDGAGHRDGIDYDYDHENLDDDDDEEEEELNETIRHHVLGVPSQDGSKSMLERIRDTSRRLRTEEEAGTAAAANIAAGMPSKDSGDSQLESWYGSISSTSSGRGRAANRRNHDRVGRDAAAADDMTIADGRSGHGDGGGGGGGDHRAPPRQPSSDSLLQEFSDDLFVHAVILQQAEGVFDALPSNATLDSNVVNRLCLTIEECLRTTAASSTWPEACPDELESELAASVRGVMVKHLGSPVAACRARALQDIDSLLYDEMVFNKVIEQVDRSYQKEMAELRVAQAELLREETSLTKERRATMDKLSQDRQQRLQSLISASSKGDDDDDRGRDGGDVHGAPPLHYLPTLHDDDDGGRGSHGDNRGRTGADDGDEDGEEEEEADVAALHDLLFSQMLGAATAASADMGEGSHVITPDEFMTQHIQLPADGSGDDTRVHVNGRRVPQQPATDDAFVESSSSSSSSSPATAASVSPSTTAGTTTEPRPDEQGSSNARESGDGEAADADGEDADTPSDSRAEAETGEEDQEGGGDDDSEVVVVTADVEDDDFDHDMTVISARLSDAGLVSPQADGDGGDYDDEEEDGEEDEEDELVNGCQREAMAKYMFAMSELGEEESGADDTSGSPVLQQRHMNCDYRNTADDAQLHDLFAKIDAAAVEDDASAVHEAELTPDTLATPTDF